MAFNARRHLQTWPRSLMRDRMLSWALTGRTVSGGRALSGAMPLVRFDGGGLWTATLGDVQISTPDQVRAWRALAASLDGGATPVILEARDERHAPWPTVGGVAVSEATRAYADDTAVADDGATFVGSAIDASIAEDAALRATVLSITLANAANLRGGEYFSIEHDRQSHRLYVVAAVIQSETAASIRIRPPLREAVEAGTRLEFDRPKCVMQLAEPSAMDVALERRIYGYATVKFIERLGPFEEADELSALPSPVAADGLLDDDGTLLLDDDGAVLLDDAA